MIGDKLADKRARAFVLDDKSEKEKLALKGVSEKVAENGASGN